jgi:hypothetical protein
MNDRKGDVRQPLARPRQGGGASPSAPGRALSDHVLALQEQAGNKAVTAMIQRIANVTAEFVGSTPAEGAQLRATGDRYLQAEAFRVMAEFAPARRYDTDAEWQQLMTSGEYRQFVKGAFTANGAVHEHRLDGGAMSQDSWTEDSIDGKKYGYRQAAPRNRPPEAYYRDRGCNTKDMANGPFYKAFDAPKAVEEDDEMFLEFEGRLVDTADGGNVLQTRHWTVSGRKQVGVPLLNEAARRPAPAQSDE